MKVELTMILGVWPFKEKIKEMTLLADNYDMTISLLLFDDHAPFRQFDEVAEDTFDHFNKIIHSR